MEDSIPDMLDMVFDLKGTLIPEDYAFALNDELIRLLPWLASEEFAGILPLRGSITEEGILLARRSKLILRLPAKLARQSSVLSGQTLNIGFGTLYIGEGQERFLQSHPTLHAHMVEGAIAEEIFVTDVANRLLELGVSCKWICGKRHTVNGMGQSLSGYSLVLHDLKPDASLLVQRAGLGGSRRFGCGIFVPYKDISGLD